MCCVYFCQWASRHFQALLQQKSEELGITIHNLEIASLRSRWPTLSSRSYYAGSSVSQAVVRKYSEAQKRK